MLESKNWSWFLSVIFNLTRFSIHLLVKLLQYLETITYTWACFKQVSAKLFFFFLYIFYSVHGKSRHNIQWLYGYFQICIYKTKTYNNRKQTNNNRKQTAKLMCTKNISRKLVGLMLTNTSPRKIFFCKTLRLMISPIRVVMVLGTRGMKLLTNMIHPWIFCLE